MATLPATNDRRDGFQDAYTSSSSYAQLMPSPNENQPSNRPLDDDANMNVDDDDEFRFNAPSYYDLKNPDMEKKYVNNADGYFFQQVQDAAQRPPSPTTPMQPTPAPSTRAQTTPAPTTPMQSTPRPATPMQSTPTPTTAKQSTPAPFATPVQCTAVQTVHTPATPTLVSFSASKHQQRITSQAVASSEQCVVTPLYAQQQSTPMCTPTPVQENATGSMVQQTPSSVPTSQQQKTLSPAEPRTPVVNAFQQPASTSQHSISAPQTPPPSAFKGTPSAPIAERTPVPSAFSSTPLQTPSRPPLAPMASSTPMTSSTSTRMLSYDQHQFHEYRTPKKLPRDELEEDEEMKEEEDAEAEEATAVAANDEDEAMSESSHGTLVLETTNLNDHEEQQQLEEHDEDTHQYEETTHDRRYDMTPHASCYQQLYQSQSSSKLMQPTQAYLLRLQAEQMARERSMVEGLPYPPPRNKPPRPTRPRSPKLRTREKAAARNLQFSDNNNRLSSTSRELQRVQEEKMQVEMEKMKIWEYHERVKAQRPPTSEGVHQRSTKQLTIPMSPHLEVGHRDRCFLHQTTTGAPNDADQDDGFDCMADVHEQPHPYIRPETLLSRDFTLPTQSASRSYHLERTVPQSPFLETAHRAGSKLPASRAHGTPEKALKSPDYTQMKVGGVTKPITPQLETERRAHVAATCRKPIEVVDSDEEELAKQFHAKPLNKKILACKPKTLVTEKPKPPLTKPISPKFATSARFATRKSTLQQQKAEQEREQKRKQRMKAKRESNQVAHQQPQPHQPVVPSTPPLTSLQRHKMYQEEFKKRLQHEEEERKRQRQFKAQPIRLKTTPPKFQPATKPLTEVVPFALESEKIHGRAREKLELKRREEEEQLRMAAQFKAMPMPAIHDPQYQHKAAPAFQLKPSTKPLTRCAPPMLASDRRAAERAAFDAAEKDRRAREEAMRKQMEAERRRREEEEVRRLRREKLVFHARPVPQTKPFELKPTNKPLTEPASPAMMTRTHHHAHEQQDNQQTH